ncbi:MAG: type 4a pilus biogenesis protein PilO [Anaerolineales bacterium]
MKAVDLREMLSEPRALLLPGLALLLVVGNLAFGALVIAPTYSQAEDARQQVAAARTQISARDAVDSTDMSDIDAQRAHVETQLATAVVGLLSETEIDGLLAALYDSAANHEVEVVSLQTRDAEAETGAAVTLRDVEIVMQGSAQRLMQMLAGVPTMRSRALQVRDLQLRTAEASQLTLGLVFYGSAFATPGPLPVADVFAEPPAQSTAMAPQTLAAVVVTPTQPTPTMVTPVRLPSATPSPSPSPTLTPLPSATPFTDMVIGPGTYDDDSAALNRIAGEWVYMESVNGYGGHYHYSLDADAALAVNFIGTSIAVQFVAYNNFGIFELYIDDVLYQEVDGYAPQGTFGQSVYLQDLGSGVHTLTIRNTGRANPASDGTVIAIDAVHVFE